MDLNLFEQKNFLHLVREKLGQVSIDYRDILLIQINLGKKFPSSQSRRRFIAAFQKDA